MKFKATDQERSARNLRLRKMIDEAGGPSAVSRKLGVALSTMSSYLAGADFPLHFAGKLVEAFGGSLDWLILGKAPISDLYNQTRPVRKDVLLGIASAYASANDFDLNLGVDWFNKVVLLTEFYLRDRESNEQTGGET